MKILISAALGALVLVASPASAQLYKAGTVTATPRIETKERAASHRHHKSAAQTYHKPGTPTFMLPSTAAAKGEAKAPAMAVDKMTDAKPGHHDCCDHGKAGAMHHGDDDAM